MNFPLKHNVPERLFPTRNQLTAGTARSRNVRRYLKSSCGLLAMTWPLAAVFAQFSSSPQLSSSASQQSSSQPSSTQAQPPSQAQPANPDQPRQKEDSLAEAARKAKAKKAAAAKGKVYTEDDLSGLKGPGVSVVGDAPKKGARRVRPTDPGGDGGDNIAYINDRNGQLKNLEKRKADLEKQLDELQDEGRKAGAPASWFR